jgi:hypothetical protein
MSNFPKFPSSFFFLLPIPKLRPLGKLTSGNTHIPYQVSFPGPVLDVASGGSFTLALLEDGTLLSWGKNTDGQLGGEWETHEGGEESLVDGPPERATPKPVGILRGKKNRVVSFGCAYEKCFAVLEGGEILLWGNPTQVPWASNIKRLVHEPFPESEEVWEKIFQWLFLGRIENNSAFSSLPVEVLFHVTSVMFKNNYF